MPVDRQRRLKVATGHVKFMAGDSGACGSCNTPRAHRVRGAFGPPPPPMEPKTQTNPCSADAYGWRGVHADLENGVYAGSYGWDNAAYWGIAEQKAGIDLREWYKTRTDAEFYLPEFKDLIDNPETQKDWDRIATFDPMGMYAHPPSIAACKAHLDIPELKDMELDGEVITADNEIVTSKCAIYYAWNLPFLSERLELTEDELRKALHKYSRDDRLLDPKIKTYIPAVGGCTVYTFGDARKLRDPKTEVTVRVHDECIGSDVFGSDICSCRPYLIFALRMAVETAQRGGVGVVVYFRKEGRSLGEVIKFRVYNARINQEGGDRSDQYFQQTETIAGIRDARFQTMMPDVLNWMGIKRIDYLCSMSNEKYEAIVGAGIRVMQRVTLPEDYIKESMKVELDAKIASGYHSDYLEKDAITAQLMQIGAVRKQCGRIYDLAKSDKLDFFSINESNLPKAVDLVEKVIRDFYPKMDIPGHSRLRHLGDVDHLLAGWTCDATEKARRLVDLVTISVLLDAGAGPAWKYVTADGSSHSSSEGLALASLDLFNDGFFSSDPAVKTRVNSYALINLDDERFARGMQVSRQNMLAGFNGRAKLLKQLGAALEAHPEFFGKELARPGNMVDYILANAQDGKVSLTRLWEVCSIGFGSIWPKQANGILQGDMWTHSKLQVSGQPGSDLVPFHKLTQWLAYSLIDTLKVSIGLEVVGAEQLTCLAEYRNGGLLMDTGVIKLKDESWLSQEVNVGTELIVEWRALTVVLIDRVATELRKRFGLSEQDLTLAKVLEGGTWRAGRVVALSLRPDGSPPIRIRSDGTVF